MPSLTSLRFPSRWFSCAAPLQCGVAGLPSEEASAMLVASHPPSQSRSLRLLRSRSLPHNPAGSSAAAPLHPLNWREHWQTPRFSCQRQTACCHLVTQRPSVPEKEDCTPSPELELQLVVPRLLPHTTASPAKSSWSPGLLHLPTPHRSSFCARERESPLAVHTRGRWA